MKQDIHPDYVLTHVTCSCGNTFTTRSVKPEMHVELCNQCHPFYTGKQKLVDTGGRVERFNKKYANRTAVEGSSAAPSPGPVVEITPSPPGPVVEIAPSPEAEADAPPGSPGPRA